MTMKTFTSITFACALVLAGCGKSQETATSAPPAGGGSSSTAAAPPPVAPSTAPSASAPAVANAATLAGVVKFAGTPPKPAPIQMGADPYCQSQHQGGQGAQDEEVVVGPGGELANVLVYIKNAPSGATPPAAPAVLDQKGCRYYPHVNAVMVGQELQIKNSDATLHNVHAMAEANPAFNEGQPVQGMVSTKKFDKPELKPFRIKCDVHGWMKSYMAVMPHPYYAVSQMNGSFSIPNLPPGNYTVVAWHEKYGEQEQQITVGPKESKQIAFTFKG